MDNSAKIEYKGKTYTFPIITGSENEEAIDIKNLRSESGHITYDPGYKNTGHCISDITYLDGENGDILQSVENHETCAVHLNN